MRIGIDARLYGVKNGGIGRFTEEFLRALAAVKTPHTFVVFLRKQDMARARARKNIEKICAEVQPFTIKEQLVLPILFHRSKLDLLHIPHHAVAAGYGGKTMLTVHDLIEYRAERDHATSLLPFVYRIKRAAFRHVFEDALRRASAVVAVSRFVRRDLAKTFPALSTEMPVVHHGAPAITDENFLLPVLFPYILYAGTLAPHKNVERLVAAYRYAVEKSAVREHLVLVIPKDFRYQAWKKTLEMVPASIHRRIHTVHALSERRLAQYMTHARLFVSASQEEGYGLPCIESLVCGTPVLAGFTGALPEMSVRFPAGKVLYWDTRNVLLMGKQLVDALRLPPEHFDSRAYRKNLSSWNDVAQAYIHLYQNVLKI